MVRPDEDRVRPAIAAAKLSAGDETEVRVDRIVPRGLGIGFANGLTVFVALAAPGDLLRVRLTEIRKRIAFAEITAILEPGPDRVEAPCRHFGICGGCDLQHLSYEAQCRAKAGIIADCLRRIGKINYDREIPIVTGANEFAYRSRARWHADGAKKKLGYFKRSSHEVANIEECPILTPGLHSALENLRATIDWDAISSPAAEIDAAESGGKVSIYSDDLIVPTNEITFAFDGGTYQYSARSFFQANQYLVGALIELAVGGSSGTTALDLYSGAGLFTLPLARSFSRVVAVEASPISHQFAGKNVAEAGLENVELICSSVSGYLGSERPAADLVVLDPPRSGPERNTIELICEIRPREISYVSCEPSILARDLRTLLDAGYGIDRLTGVDLFPQTHHVETVVRMRAE